MPADRPAPTRLDCGRALARRLGRALAAWFAGSAAALLLVGCMAAAASAPAPVAQAVAPGVYVVRGASGEVDGSTQGRIGNAGFIVGDAGVIAIDTGTSYRHGQALLAAIARVTDKPVLRVYITHTRQEFLFGAAAFRERGIPIHMHRLAARLMAARCETCLKNLRSVLGEDAMRGTAVVKPDVAFEDGHRTDAIGRPVSVHYFGPSSGPGDVAVLDERSGVLFAGGLVDWQRIPDVVDGQLADWQRALHRLQALAPTAVVPGHGPLAPPEAIETESRYLRQLQDRMAELLRADVALSAVPDQSTLPEFAGWDQADTVHRRNASVVYLRLEREQLLKSETVAP